MYNVTIVYDNKQDRELVELINTKLSFFVDFIDMNCVNGRKEGFKILNYWSAKKLPFVVVKEDDTEKLPKVFYSETGNAINQFIKWYESKN